ncbi:GumC family protein [Pontibacter akesuensis]|uniref:non-specific protein-tyrosine kinase n=1 Tax=Pontibacter akesuensis TaxID=388950 RepID=A0A1I7J203_9BACT|nr:tyrosine-protein kinase family protein [Pontibacter akesuensis]GHA72918.1 tyrosine protein kinase [Pontibacter akesuensis]SFU79154.1 capsular exopolysaccharide family [Pontibacter akesuensis]
MEKAKLNDNLVGYILFKYLPFWPLFVILLAVSMLGAWGYLRYYATPVYSATASLIVKDEKKGVNDSKMTESIDAFTSNKIVENEINVLSSHELMNKVVNRLGLYAPVFEDEEFKSVSAYITSPINIELQSPEKVKEQAKVYFTFDEQRRQLTINNKIYPLNQWLNTPYGVIRFTSNARRTIVSPNSVFYFSLVNPKAAANKLLGNVIIESPGKLSSVVNLYVRDEVPERGEDVLNTLIYAYQEETLNDRNKLAAQTLEFVEGRIQIIEKELDELEKKIVQYKSAQGAVDLNEQGKLFLQNVGNNDRRISEINLQLAVLDRVERYVISKENTTGIVPSTLGVNDPVLSQLLQKLYNTEIEHQQLSKTTAENNPIILSLTQEISSIRPSILENIQNQRDNLLASRINLLSTNNRYNAVIQNIPQKERELLEISRQQSVKNNAYSFLLQKREETVLSYAPTAEDIRIVDMASSSKKPISPKPLYAYVAAILFALGSGVALVAGKEMLNSKLLFRSEIENHIKFPIVAELSTSKSKMKAPFEKPVEVSVVEQFRQLRATMGLYGRTFTKKKIMVTSSIPGEGKSYVSTNLACSLASSGKRVALLDFDLRNPNASNLFEMRDQPGIIEFMNEEVALDEIIRDTSCSNLYLVPAGMDVGDHTELLLNGKLEQLFGYLESAMDYIIIDTPPIDLISDAYLLSEYSDITLLVMRHAYTPKNIVQRLSQSNKLASLNNVAIIFNGVKPRGYIKGQYGYGYGYGYENRYGDKTYMSRKVKA